MTNVLRRHQRANLFTEHDALDIARLIHVEDDHGQVVVFTQTDRRQVHYLQALAENFHIGDFVIFHGIFKQNRIGVVNALNFSALQEHIRFDFHRAQAGGSIGREKGITNAGGEDDDATLFEMAHRASTKVGLGNLIHENGGHHAALHIALFESVLQRDRVDDGGEHAHIVGAHPVHLFGLLSHAAKDVTTADDDGNFDA